MVFIHNIIAHIIFYLLFKGLFKIVRTIKGKKRFKLVDIDQSKLVLKPEGVDRLKRVKHSFGVFVSLEHDQQKSSERNHVGVFISEDFLSTDGVKFLHLQVYGLESNSKISLISSLLAYNKTAHSNLFSDGKSYVDFIQASIQHVNSQSQSQSQSTVTIPNVPLLILEQVKHNYEERLKLKDRNYNDMLEQAAKESNEFRQKVRGKNAKIGSLFGHIHKMKRKNQRIREENERQRVEYEEKLRESEIRTTVHLNEINRLQALIEKIPNQPPLKTTCLESFPSTPESLSSDDSESQKSVIVGKTESVQSKFTNPSTSHATFGKPEFHHYSKPEEKCNMTNPKPKPNANSYPHKDINPNKVETPKRKKNGKRDFRYSENRRFLVDPDGIYRNLGSPDKRYKENKNSSNFQYFQ